MGYFKESIRKGKNFQKNTWSLFINGFSSEFDYRTIGRKKQNVRPLKIMQLFDK